MSAGSANTSASETTTTDSIDKLQITLNNGDEFYVLAALVAAADGAGAVANAFSTFQMGLNTRSWYRLPLSLSLLQPGSSVPVCWDWSE